ncbi:MAG: hexameric tyrosine-coordinated heme protein [Tepidiforma sp.]
MRSALRSAYACNADSLTAAGHVVALEFATIAAANTYWRYREAAPTPRFPQPTRRPVAGCGRWAGGRLGEKGYDPVFGARPLRRVIQDNIEDRLSEMLLSGQFAAGDTIRIDAEDGQLKIEPIREPQPVG